MNLLKIGFIVISLLSVALFYWGTGKDKRVLIFFSIWMIAIGALSYFGFFQNINSVPPRILVVIIPSTLYTIYFLKTLDIQSVQKNYLLAIHVVRIPVELILYQLFLEKKIPIIMTFGGWNYDIIIGVTAFVLLLFGMLSRNGVKDSILKIWNLTGVCFLATIVTIAVLSAPTPIQQFAFDQPNIAILEFPFTLLAALVVPIVLLSHLLLLKMGNQNDKSQPFLF